MTDIPQAIREIAEKVGTTAEAAWPLYVRFVWADALSVCLCAAETVLVVWVAAAIFVVRTRNIEDQDARAGFCFGALVVAIFAAVLCSITASQHLAAVIAPDGAAIAEVLRRVAR